MFAQHYALTAGIPLKPNSAKRPLGAAIYRAETALKLAGLRRSTTASSDLNGVFEDPPVPLIVNDNQAPSGKYAHESFLCRNLSAPSRSLPCCFMDTGELDAFLI